MKVVYYVKIDRKDSGVDLSFPNFPSLGKVFCPGGIDDALLTARATLREFAKKESFLPNPIPYYGEEFYPVHIDV